LYINRTAYNSNGAPTSSDVAALMIGELEMDITLNPSNCNILLGTHEGSLQKISVLHNKY
jgi:hypothetical protein